MVELCYLPQTDASGIAPCSFVSEILEEFVLIHRGDIKKFSDQDSTQVSAMLYVESSSYLFIHSSTSKVLISTLITLSVVYKCG